MTDFTKLTRHLAETFQPSPWSQWAEQRENERLLWLSQHTHPKGETEPLERTPMTALEQDAARALGKCTYLPGSFEKRFARDMASHASSESPQITERQRAWLWKQVYRYRKQIKDKDLIEQAARETGAAQARGARRKSEIKRNG